MTETRAAPSRRAPLVPTALGLVWICACGCAGSEGSATGEPAGGAEATAGAVAEPGAGAAVGPGDVSEGGEGKVDEGGDSALPIADAVGAPAGSGDEATGEDQPAAIAAPASGLSIIPGEGIWTSVRGLTDAPVLSFEVRNTTAATVSVGSISIIDSDLFAISDAPALPATLVAGASLSISVELVTDARLLPAAPPQDSGSTLAAGSLLVTSGSDSARARLQGLILTQALWEPTLGQVLDALGYSPDIGNTLRTRANPNSLPGVDSATDELDAPRFVRAGAGPVTLEPVARFSPLGVMPFGFYTPGDAGSRVEVGTMDAESDRHTSDKARMVLPPYTGGSFDPGADPFGVWAFTNQVAEQNPRNGDELYSEDALNVTGTPHRVKVYPLVDASGASVDNSYLLACEEAANGDYQDYVFVLSNVTPAP